MRIFIYILLQLAREAKKVIDVIETVQYLIRDKLNFSSSVDIEAVDVGNLNITDVGAANNISIDLHNIARLYITACSKTKYALSTFIGNLDDNSNFVISSEKIAIAKINEVMKIRNASKASNVYSVEPFVFVWWHSFLYTFYQQQNLRSINNKTFSK